MYVHPVDPPASDVLADLVRDFSAALLEKLRESEAKYNHKNAWMRDDWREDLLKEIRAHVEKGDPRDVAAYAAFAWFHQWKLASDA